MIWHGGRGGGGDLLLIGYGMVERALVRDSDREPSPRVPESGFQILGQV